MRTLKAILAYDGSGFVGWQRQRSGRSVQGELERVCAEIEGRSVPIAGAGRTDAGVHALGQVASFQLSHHIESASLVRAFNAKLPPSIRVIDVRQVDDGFHARFSAHEKTYRYYISSSAVGSPFTRMHVWHVGRALDLESIQAAGQVFVGKHDFAAFQAAGAKVKSTVRNIYRVGVSIIESTSGIAPDTGTPLVAVEVVGDGFLRHMVRIMVGTLVGVGSGRMPAESVSKVITSRRRELAGVTAPARGLFLVSVRYTRGLTQNG